MKIKKSVKGQFGLEYILTHAWMVLTVIIVLSFLFYFFIFNYNSAVSIKSSVSNAVEGISGKALFSQEEVEVPSQVSQNSYMEIIINPSSKGIYKFAYIYDSEDKLIEKFSFDCEDICKDKKTTRVFINDSYIGKYYIAVFSYESENYIKKDFEVVSSVVSGECTLKSAYWDKEEANNKETVDLILESQGCEGKQAVFSIYESDLLSRNFIGNISARINGDVTRVRWNAEWENDAIFPSLYKNNPEYVFKVSVNPEIWSYGKLVVYEGEIPAEVYAAVSGGILVHVNTAKFISLGGIDSQGRDSMASSLANNMTFEILTEPEHGILSGNNLVGVQTAVLTYMPDKDYQGADSFTYRVIDGAWTGQTYIVRMNVAPWTLPIGIPDPGFGIKESYRMYDNPANRNPNLTYTQNSKGGYYTHYIDSSNSNATDTTNPYGTPSRPRVTIPMNLPAGSVVEVHSLPIHTVEISGTGTVAQPIFIRGPDIVNRVAVNGVVSVGYYFGNAAYIIMENFAFLRGILILARDNSTVFTNSHITLRNSESYDNDDGSAAAIATWSPNKIHDVVFYNNLMHDNGVWDPLIAVGDEDYMGIAVTGNGTHNIWVLHNEMYHNSGDGLQILTGVDDIGGVGTGYNIYVGRNVAHHNKQSGLWCKQAMHVIFSQNIAYGHRVSSSATGAGMGFQLEPENVWFLFNHIYDNDQGIAAQGGQNSYFIGNVIQDIHAVAMRFRGGVNRHVIGNTIYGADLGIWGSEGGSQKIVNNIITNITSPYIAAIFVDSTALAAATGLWDNLFYHNGESIQISWGDDHVYDKLYNLTAFKTAFPGVADGSFEVNPLFVNATNNNFNLQENSPAIDAGNSELIENISQTFYNLYGIDIRKDIEGRIRPQGNGWDIGAYEYSSGVTEPVCGNNLKETGEVCDGSDLGGESCASRGMKSGTLRCLQGCSGFDAKLCLGPIVIDHTSTNLSKIPQYWLDKAKELTIQYAHRSDGNQLIEGAIFLNSVDSVKYRFLERDVGAGGVAALPIQTSPPGLRLMDGNPPLDAYSVPGLYWQTAAGINATRNNAETSLFNYSMWSWCDELTYPSWTNASIQPYLNQMDAFEKEFPNMRFIYMTAFVYNTATNVNNNKFVRDYAVANDKVLYDFEDIGKYAPNGTYYSNADRVCTWCVDWCANNPSDCASLPANCAHSSTVPSNKFICVQRGRAFWWMMARLAGWDGMEISLNKTPSKPRYSSFNGNTTSFDSVPNITQVQNAVLEKTSFGKIQFSGAIDFSSLDLDSYVKIEDKKIAINPLEPGMTRLDIPATLTFYNIRYSNPLVKKDGVNCNAPDCTNIIFNAVAGILKVDVLGFSNYTIDENSTGNLTMNFTFAVYGDSRTGNAIHQSIVNMIVIDNPAFVLHTGDLVGTGSSVAEWDTFRQIAAPLLSHTPSSGLTSYFYPAPGNHEYNGDSSLTYYFNVFNISPINQHYYSFDYKNAHFISLDVTNTWNPADFEPGSAQYNWLVNDLQKADSNSSIKWKFVFFHAPVFSCVESHACGPAIQQYLMTLFDKYGVTAVFGGDDHSYQRIGPVKNYSLNEYGTTYIITAGAGASIYPFYTHSPGDCNFHEDREDMPCDGWTGLPHRAVPLTTGVDSSGDAYHYVRFTVKDSSVTGEAIRRDGSKIETFTINSEEFVCGNNLKETGEECDGSDFGNFGNGIDKCSEYSPFYVSGNLVCSGCKMNLSKCQLPVCGNGIRELNESCDGSDFGIYGNGIGKCNNYNNQYSTGNLACSGCAIRTNSCVLGICGDNKTNSGEECDDGNLISGDECSASCKIEYNPKTVYVDNSLTGNCLTYNPSTRSCVGGSETAYNSLAQAASVAKPDYTVIIKSGTYNEILKPAYSGVDGHPITFKADGQVTLTLSAYDSRVMIPPLDAWPYFGPIWLEEKNFIIIDGINVRGTAGYARFLRANNNTLQNCHFYDAHAVYPSSWIQASHFFESHDNKIFNNTIEDASDNMGFYHSDRNVIENNKFYNGDHVLLTIKCGSYNIVRNNYFNNQLQKIMEVLDCEQPTMAHYCNVPFNQDREVVNSTKYNLIENNTFAYTPPSATNRYSGIQYAAQNGIIRRNLFYDINGGGLGTGVYCYEAEFNEHNRVYNNVFYNNNFGGIYHGYNGCRDPPDEVPLWDDDIYKNNILYKNLGQQILVTGWCDVNCPRMRGFYFENNNILNKSAGERVFVYSSNELTFDYPLSEVASRYPSLFSNNLEVNPGFVNENNRNFKLNSSSPMIDNGTFLTKTIGAGSGTSMRVEDAGYFYDGFGIRGQQGDLIQLENSQITARITGINYITNTLTLDKALTWSNGVGVSLAYSGNKPDIGAYEYSGEIPVARTIYVDKKLASDCLGNYSIAKRNCSGSDGTAFNTIQKGVNNATAGDTVYIRGGVSQADPYSIYNITTDYGIEPKRAGRADARITIVAYPGDTVVLQGDINHYGQTGISMTSLTSYYTIRGFVFKTFRDGNTEDASAKMSLVIENCEFAYMTRWSMQIYNVTNLILRDVYVHHGGNSGIYINGGDNILLERVESSYNNVGDGDGIAINLLGTATAHLVDCVAHDNLDGFDLTANAVVEGCLSYNNSQVNIKCWRRGTDNLAEKNYTIKNSIIYGAGECGIRVTNGPSVNLYNNVIYGNQEQGIWFLGMTLPVQGPNVIKSRIINNLFMNNGISWPPAINVEASVLPVTNVQQVDADHNLYFNNRQPNSGLNSDTNSITVDPLFADVANHDFHLKANSPAIDAGTSLAGIVDSDFDGNSRPQGKAWDIGAYEYAGEIPAGKEDNNFSFVFIGDDNNDNAQLAIRFAYQNYPNLAAVFSIPDNGWQTRNATYLRYKNEWIRLANSTSNLAPIFMGLGNHDIEVPDNVDFQVKSYGPTISSSLPGMKNFKEGPYDTYTQHGNYQDRFLQYSFDYKNAHFIVMNPYYHDINLCSDASCDRFSGAGVYGPMGCVSEDMLNWLEEDLKNTSATFKFMFYHEGAWPAPGGRHTGDSLDYIYCPGNTPTGARWWENESRPMRDKFWNLLAKYNVTANFVGHAHHSTVTWANDPFKKYNVIYEIEPGEPTKTAVVNINGDDATLRMYDDTHSEIFGPIKLSEDKDVNYNPKLYHHDAGNEQGFPPIEKGKYVLEVDQSLSGYTSLYFEAKDNDVDDKLTFSFNNLPYFLNITDWSSQFRRISLRTDTSDSQNRLTVSDIGNYSFDVIVNDSRATDKININLSVLPVGKPVLLGASIPDKSVINFPTNGGYIYFLCRDNESGPYAPRYDSYYVKYNGTQVNCCSMWHSYATRSLTDNLAISQFIFVDDWDGVDDVLTGRYDITVHCSDAAGHTSDNFSLSVFVSNESSDYAKVYGSWPNDGASVNELTRMSFWAEGSIAGLSLNQLSSAIQVRRNSKVFSDYYLISSSYNGSLPWGNVDIIFNSPQESGIYEFNVSGEIFTVTVGKIKNVIYVDNQLISDCLGNYSIAKRNCSGSDGIAYKTIEKAANISTAGTTVLIRNGTYAEYIMPNNSGVQGNPITFMNFGNETVVITGRGIWPNYFCDKDTYPEGFLICSKSYITIRGINFNFENMISWGKAFSSDNIIISDNRFMNAGSGGFTRSIGFISSRNISIINNVLINGSDNIVLVNTTHTLIEGNNVTIGSHSLFSINCGSYNIIRNNYFYNEIQKIGEMIDCNISDPDHGPSIYYGIYYDNSTQHNLVENNTFAYTAPGSSYSGIQYAGQNGIIRNNLFYNCNGAGIQIASYPDEAKYNLHNRVYNNVFYNNTAGAIETGYSFAGSYITDNIFKNNILYKGYPAPRAWQDYCLGGSMITHHSTMANFLFERNNIINNIAGESTAILYRYNRTMNLSTAQTNYPSLYANNVEVNPGFVDAESYNFQLNSSSQMINAGAFLTQTVGAGSGTVLPVVDARYFFDGYGMNDENGLPIPGDVIQLQADTRTARIVSVDYATNTLTLDRALSWANGTGVSLAYLGSKPDIGAYEYLITPCQDYVKSVESHECINSMCVNDKLVFTTNNSFCNDNDNCTLDACTRDGCQHKFDLNRIECLDLIKNCEDKDNDGVLDYDPAKNCTIGKDRCIRQKTNLTSAEMNSMQPKAVWFNITYSGTDMRNISEFKIYKENIAEIKFKQMLDLVRLNESGCFDAVNIDPLVEIYNRKVKIYSEDFSELNKPAIITFYNVSFLSPKINKDGAECSDCKIVSYDSKSQILVVEVSGFSEYEVVEGYSGGNGDGGNNGGGGGAGSEIPTKLCNESWSCGEWSVCENGAKTRICIDKNDCRIAINKPETTRSCEVEKPFIEQAQNQIGNIIKTIKLNAKLIIFVFVSILIMAAVILFIIFQVRSRAIEKRIQRRYIAGKAERIVEEARRRGYSDSQIAEMFKKKGWKDSDVDRIMK